MPALHRRAFIKSAAVLGLGGYAVARTGVVARAWAAEPGAVTAAAAGHPMAVCNNFRRAAEVAGEILAAGTPGLDAVEQGIRVIESDPNVNTVGFGGLPNWEGVVELDAAIMHGPTTRCGAVAALQDIENPISVARKVMEESEHVLLVGQGARDFALKMGFQQRDLLTDEARRDWQRWKEWREKEIEYESLQQRVAQLTAADAERAANAFRQFCKASADSTRPAVLVFWGLDKETSSSLTRVLSQKELAELSRAMMSMDKSWVPPEVRTEVLKDFEGVLTGQRPQSHDTLGLIVLDSNGDLCCGVSSSGQPLKLPGRAGDCAVIGAGAYVDNEVGGVVATGMGEHMIRFVTAHTVVENMRHGMSPEEACKEVIGRMVKKIEGADVVLTALSKGGEYAHVGTWETEGYVFSGGQVALIEEVLVQR